MDGLIKNLFYLIDHGTYLVSSVSYKTSPL